MQPIKNFMQDEQSLLAGILKQAAFLSDLNAKIAQHLRPELALHCCVASLREGLLRVAVDSSAFAMQLRYDTPSLLNQFQLDKQLPKITALECYVDAMWRGGC
jgi:hypothetical protein